VPSARYLTGACYVSQKRVRSPCSLQDELANVGSAHPYSALVGFERREDSALVGLDAAMAADLFAHSVVKDMFSSSMAMSLQQWSAGMAWGLKHSTCTCQSPVTAGCACVGCLRTHFQRITLYVARRIRTGLREGGPNRDRRAHPDFVIRHERTSILSANAI
jgi:hypothetical protein